MKYVPLQDFTPASDIDWSKSIAQIDRQLYAKYGLDEKDGSGKYFTDHDFHMNDRQDEIILMIFYLQEKVLWIKFGVNCIVRQ